ncbi:hypothetical protein ACE02D_09120 [Shewanella bicestrii]|uniref:Uncharacterized protein n=2 Tax=Shewanella TaxID=22 RepID=A0A220UJQ1_9GAMM|nr:MULTISPECIES: hypothetical protein [Shewanella]ASK68369.1 hypothetical protein CF168_05490 [Shewanella bicestrii]QXN26033.1 hypothetical protein KVP08_005460 [Shewanella putrefaciens]ABK49296.1 hypothetical protein Shewana3_3072 [Shewanella sp. ANA-3]MCL1120697.1 hypothetical protein [Shewanella seohaensis]MDH0449648.1 hypothetical protein [Shewanella sp. GD04112]
MTFVLRSLMLLGSLVWLTYSGKQLIALGILHNPSLMVDHITLTLQVLVAAVVFKSALGSKRSDSY